MRRDFHELPKLRDSISYIYVEHCNIEQDDLSIAVVRKNERIPIPISATTAILIGPGTRITHAAVRAMSDSGCMAIWCGENLQKFYAFGSPETRSAKNILKQAQLCMDENLHAEVARKMYEIRFPKLPEGQYTIQQLRGMEGIRVREAYKLASKISGVRWESRSYKTSDWDNSDEINKALSQANAILYSVCEAAIVSLGFSTALGFIHTGKMLSFVYDIADLYKVETTIPAAFEATKEGFSSSDISKLVKVKCRQKFNDINLMKRIPKDIAKVFDVNDREQEDAEITGELWDNNVSTVAGGKNYGVITDDSDCD